MCRMNMLEWGNIPREQVWVKIGGDGGGGSTKFFYQVANTAKTNSIKNTIAFCVYAADERTSNLHTALDHFIPQIDALQNSKWRYSCISMKACE